MMDPEWLRYRLRIEARARKAEALLVLAEQFARALADTPLAELIAALAAFSVEAHSPVRLAADFLCEQRKLVHMDDAPAADPKIRALRCQLEACKAGERYAVRRIGRLRHALARIAKGEVSPAIQLARDALSADDDPEPGQVAAEHIEQLLRAGEAWLEMAGEVITTGSPAWMTQMERQAAVWQAFWEIRNAATRTK